MRLDRATMQTIATKLDLGHITVKEAKRFLHVNYGLAFVARTRDQLVRKMGLYLSALERE